MLPIDRDQRGGLLQMATEHDSFFFNNYIGADILNSDALRRTPNV